MAIVVRVKVAPRYAFAAIGRRPIKGYSIATYYKRYQMNRYYGKPEENLGKVCHRQGRKGANVIFFLSMTQIRGFPSYTIATKVPLGASPS